MSRLRIQKLLKRLPQGVPISQPCPFRYSEFILSALGGLEGVREHFKLWPRNDILLDWFLEELKKIGVDNEHSRIKL